MKTVTVKKPPRTANSRTAVLGRLLDRSQADAKNLEAALSYQARAWRICALIGLAHPEQGKIFARWLMFKTVPWVDGVALDKFISEHQEEAAQAGRESGVFDK